MLKRVLCVALIGVFVLYGQTIARQTAPQEGATATPNAPKPWDVEAEHGPTKLVEFETDEGT